MNFTVDRKRWARGRDSRLLKNGAMCCLGFLAKACGADDDHIEDAGEPWEVSVDVVWPSAIMVRPEIGTGKIPWLRTSRSSLSVVQEIIMANDDPRLTAAEREARLIELFASAGITVEFIGEDGSVT